MSEEAPATHNEVALYSVSGDSIDRVVAAGFRDFGMDAKLRKARSVFIKPNLVSDTDEHIEAHCNTETILVEAVLKFLSQYDLDVYLGESEVNKGLIGRRVSAALDKMGITALREKYDFQIVNLTHEPAERKRMVSIEDPLYFRQLELNDLLFEVDHIINLPKLKTHKFATITCALKNYYGLIPDPFRVKYHNHLSKAVADLGGLFNEKTFHVVDGIVAMEGDGPKWGTPVPMNLLAFGADAGAVDTVAGRIMGIEAREIRHLELFLQRYSKVDPANIRVIGDRQVEDVARPFVRAKLNPYMKLERYLLPLPWVHRVIMSDFCVRHFLYPMRNLIKRIRGGHASFYLGD